MLAFLEGRRAARGQGSGSSSSQRALRRRRPWTSSAGLRAEIWRRGFEAEMPSAIAPEVLDSIVGGTELLAADGGPAPIVKSLDMSDPSVSSSARVSRDSVAPTDDRVCDTRSGNRFARETRLRPRNTPGQLQHRATDGQPQGGHPAPSNLVELTQDALLRVTPLQTVSLELPSSRSPGESKRAGGHFSEAPGHSRHAHAAESVPPPSPSPVGLGIKGGRKRGRGRPAVREDGGTIANSLALRGKPSLGPPRLEPQFTTPNDKGPVP